MPGVSTRRQVSFGNLALRFSITRKPACAQRHTAPKARDFMAGNPPETPLPGFVEAWQHPAPSSSARATSAACCLPTTSGSDDR